MDNKEGKMSKITSKVAVSIAKRSVKNLKNKRCGFIANEPPLPDCVKQEQ